MCCDNQSNNSENCCCQPAGHLHMHKGHKHSQEIIFPSRSDQIELAAGWSLKGHDDTCT